MRIFLAMIRIRCNLRVSLASSQNVSSQQRQQPSLTRSQQQRERSANPIPLHIMLSHAVRRTMIPRGAIRFATSKSVSDALSFSGYSEIDFTINETSTVYEAVQKFAAFNIGCLVTVDSAGEYRMRSV